MLADRGIAGIGPVACLGRQRLSDVLRLLGKRHYPTNGYYGSLDPPLACGSDEQAVVPGRASPRRTDECAGEYATGYTLVCSDGCREDEMPIALTQEKPALKLRSDGMGEENDHH